MKTDYDVIIAGGGMSGLITASAIGFYSGGTANILVMDRNAPEEAGKKTNNGWTCGDATSLNSLRYLEKNVGIKYQSPELEHPVKGVLVYSPDHETKVMFEGEGFILNRKLLPQRQVRDAKSFGVELKFNLSADRLTSENGYVTGVTGRFHDGTPFKASGKIVIDATGSSSVLRKFLPIESYIEREIEMDDIEATGRYIMEFDHGHEDTTHFDPDYCIIHLDQYLAPAGYCVAPGTPIVCKNSLKAVESVKVGDEVLTSEGWMPVSATSARSFTGDLVVITPFMLNRRIRVTPEHLIRVWNPQRGESWKRADELVRGNRGGQRDGDYLVLPLPKSSQPIMEINSAHFVNGITKDGFVYVSIKRSFFDGRNSDGTYRRRTRIAIHPKRTRMPTRFVLDQAFLELCGWYLSEGSIKKHHVTISNIGFDVVERVRTLARSLGYNSIIWKMRDREGRKQCYNVEITNSLLADLMASCFGKGARNKRLPPWIHEVAYENKVAFLKVLYNGDGSTEVDKRGDRSDARSLTTNSDAVSIDLWMLLASVGVVASIKENAKKKTWAVKVFGHQVVFLNETQKRAQRNQARGYHLGDGRVYLGIRSLGTDPYSGPVYDLNTAGDFTPLFNVHNCWVFPKGQNKVNIGLGVSKSGLTRRNKRFKKQDNLQSLIDEYVKNNPVLKNPRLSTLPSDAGNSKGNWQVPVRRHNDCMVANGFAVVGDAAWLPRPLDAGGIGPSIYASVILGKVVARALQAGDYSQESLWGYNVEYMTTHGYQMASFEVLRRYLQTLTNDQINYGMKHFLSEDDVRAISERRHPEFNRVQMMNPMLLLRALSEYDLAKGLRYTAKKSQTLVQHNLTYPKSPSGFADWRKTLLAELEETTEKFRPIEVAE